MTSPIILVHGAWLDASCWSPVADLLRRDGFTVVAPDLPGHGQDPAPLADQSLDAYVARIVRDVDVASAPVTLVGHSMGGVVISAVAEQRPERIARLVYLAAYLLGDGESIRDQQDPASRVPPALRPAADWSTLAIDPVQLPDIFFHDVPAPLAASLTAASAPEAALPLGTPLHVTEARWGRVPRAYIGTRSDRVITPALQERFLAAHPCEPVVWLETGHAPFAAAPGELALQLASLARDAG